MRGEKFYITGTITAETLGEICRALGEYYSVCAINGCGICFTRKEETCRRLVGPVPSIFRDV